jgi:hypothetical protein
MSKKKYSHQFVETYEGFPAFGWDRKSDESTVMCYLQMFSDDDLLKHLIPRLSNNDLETIYTLINRLMKTHLSERQYHQLFLKEDHP